MEVLLGNGDTQSAARTLIVGAGRRRRPLYEARLALQTRARRRRAAGWPRSIRAARRDAGLLDRPGDLAAQHRPERGGAAIAGEPQRVRPAAGRRRALARYRAHAGARRGQRQPMVDRLCDRRAARRPLPGRHRRQRPALWRARRLYQPRLARRHGRAAPARPARRRGADVRALRPRRALAADPRQGLLLGGARRRSPPARPAQANAWLEQAAASPDQFYGQLALERLGRGAVAARRRRPTFGAGRARRLRAAAARRGDPLSRHDRPARRPDPVRPRARRVS